MNGFAGSPEIVATDSVKDCVYPFIRETANLLYEILTLIIDWYSAQVGNNAGTSR